MYTPLNSTSTRVLTRDQMNRIAPSIFAQTPWQGFGEHKGMSERYKFIPTIEVLDMLADKGFQPVRVMQSRSRIPGKADYTRHMIRLRHAQYVNEGPLAVGQELPEIVLTNSHDGTACYEFQAGLFRLVCSNGLIVCSSDMGSVKVRHKGGSDFQDQVLDATFRVMDEAPQALAAANTWKQIELSPPKQLAFASAAAELRESEVTIEPREFLRGQRREDHAAPDGNRSLWTTMNVVQERMTKGGVRGRSQSGRRSTTRPITGVDADVKTNRALWRLTEEMAKLA